MPKSTDDAMHGYKKYEAGKTDSGMSKRSETANDTSDPQPAPAPAATKPAGSMTANSTPAHDTTSSNADSNTPADSTQQPERKSGDKIPITDQQSPVSPPPDHPASTANESQAANAQRGADANKDSSSQSNPAATKRET